MIKIGIINTVGLKYEGITSVIYNYCSNINRYDLEFSFISSGIVCEDIKNKFRNLGKIYQTDNKKMHLFNYCKDLYKILKKNKFDVIHIHGNSGTMLIESFISKMCGVPKILVHCHNTNCKYPFINKFITPIMKIFADVLIACSDASGKWLYGRSEYIVLNNAINIENFKFDSEIRNKYRKQMGLENCFVIGHVGSFTEAKNHDFIIDIFKHIAKVEPKAKLLLIGNGPCQTKMKQKAVQYNLEDKIIFEGIRKDVSNLYNVMDFFLFPSKWEGLPLVALEVQASGLPLLVSDIVTSDARCTSRFFYKSLNDESTSWAKKVLEIKASNYNRQEDFFEILGKHGFNIKLEAEKLKRIYME